MENKLLTPQEEGFFKGLLRLLEGIDPKVQKYIEYSSIPKGVELTDLAEFLLTEGVSTTVHTDSEGIFLQLTKEL